MMGLQRIIELKDDTYVLDCMCGKRFKGRTLEEAERKFFTHRCQKKGTFVNASDEEVERFSEKRRNSYERGVAHLPQLVSKTSIPKAPRGETVRDIEALLRKGNFVGLKKQPKSKKGWQEWRRKYALAFFSDQLDKVAPSASKRRYVVSLLDNWEKRFRAECAIKRPEQFVSPPGNIVEDQINFVTEYMACAIVDGTTDEKYERVEHFLSMQSAQNLAQRFELRFLGGDPLEAYAHVDSLEDIDIADAFFITDFERMIVSRPQLKKWTPRTAKRFIEEIRGDVLFDFPGAEFIVDPDPAGEVGLEIFIRVDEDARTLKMIQCMPSAFFKRFSSR